MNVERTVSWARSRACTSLAAIACGLLAAAGPDVGAAAEPRPPVLARLLLSSSLGAPGRGEPPGSECVTVALASPVRRGDTLTLLVWREDGRAVASA